MWKGEGVAIEIRWASLVQIKTRNDFPGRRTVASHDIFTPALTSLSVFFPFFKATSRLCFGERDRLTINLRPPRHCLALCRFLQSGILPISSVIFSQTGDEWRSRRGVKLYYFYEDCFFLSRVQYMMVRTIIHTTQPHYTCFPPHMVCSVNRQDEPNSALSWLAMRALSCPFGITHCVPQKLFVLFPYSKL